MTAEHIATIDKITYKKEKYIMKKSKRTLFAVLLLSGFVMSPLRGEAKTINMGRFKLTAYCPCYSCSEGWGRKTHSGNTACSEHTVAADLSILNLGDTITIDGEEYKVEDSGGGVKGDHIDIFFDTHEEVEDFGVRYGDVKIIR